MIQQAVHQLVESRNLDFEITKAIMDEVMDGQATQAQISSFFTASRVKGETIDEITAYAIIMRDKAVRLNPPSSVTDIVGTGGDEVGAFNASTTSASVATAGSVHVAKHGNRSVPSKNGVASVLKYLEAKLALTAKQAEAVLEQTGVCPPFTPSYRSPMRYAAPVRKGIGIRSIFSISGPLSNPAGTSTQLLGVYSGELVQLLAQVLANLGMKQSMVVCGGNGLDEAILTGITYVCEIHFGELPSYDITPQELELTACRLKGLIGGTPQENALITGNILSGDLGGSKQDVVVINTVVSLHLRTDDCTIKDCVKKAREIIDSDAAIGKMEEFIQITARVDLEGKKEMAS